MDTPRYRPQYVAPEKLLSSYARRVSSLRSGTVTPRSRTPEATDPSLQQQEQQQSAVGFHSILRQETSRAGVSLSSTALDDATNGSSSPPPPVGPIVSEEWVQSFQQHNATPSSKRGMLWGMGGIPMGGATSSTSSTPRTSVVKPPPPSPQPLAPSSLRIDPLLQQFLMSSHAPHRVSPSLTPAEDLARQRQALYLSESQQQHSSSAAAGPSSIPQSHTTPNFVNVLNKKRMKEQSRADSPVPRAHPPPTATPRPSNAVRSATSVSGLTAATPIRASTSAATPPPSTVLRASSALANKAGTVNRGHPAIPPPPTKKTPINNHPSITHHSTSHPIVENSSATIADTAPLDGGSSPHHHHEDRTAIQEQQQQVLEEVVFVEADASSSTERLEPQQQPNEDPKDKLFMEVGGPVDPLIDDNGGTSALHSPEQPSTAMTEGEEEDRAGGSETASANQVHENVAPAEPTSGSSTENRSSVETLDKDGDEEVGAPEPLQQTEGPTADKEGFLSAVVHLPSDEDQQIRKEQEEEQLATEQQQQQQQEEPPRPTSSSSVPLLRSLPQNESGFLYDEEEEPLPLLPDDESHNEKEHQEPSTTSKGTSSSSEENLPTCEDRRTPEVESKRVLSASDSAMVIPLSPSLGASTTTAAVVGHSADLWEAELDEFKHCPARSASYTLYAQECQASLTLTVAANLFQWGPHDLWGPTPYTTNPSVLRHRRGKRLPFLTVDDYEAQCFDSDGSPMRLSSASSSLVSPSSSSASNGHHQLGQFLKEALLPCPGSVPLPLTTNAVDSGISSSSGGNNNNNHGSDESSSVSHHGGHGGSPHQRRKQRAVQTLLDALRSCEVEAQLLMMGSGPAEAAADLQAIQDDIVRQAIDAVAEAFVLQRVERRFQTEW